MQFTSTPSSTSAHDLRLENEGIDSLTELFSTFPVGSKDDLAIIPAIFKSCDCEDCENPLAPYGTFKAHRLGRNVSAMTGFCIDFDRQTEAQYKDTLEHFRKLGYAFWHWTTYNHSPHPANPDYRFRILVPFATPYKLHSKKDWSQYAWVKLAEFFGVALNVDVSCRDPARLYYTPRRPRNSDPTWFTGGYEEGELFDWGLAVSVQAPPRFEPVVPPPVPAPEVVNLDALREVLRNQRTGEKGRLYSAMLSGNPLTLPPSKRGDGGMSRYLAWRTLTASISLALDDGTYTLEALLEIMRPSWNAEIREATGGDGPGTPWDTVVELLRSAIETAPQKKAEREAERKDAQARMMNAMLGRDVKQEAGPDEDKAEAGPNEDKDKGKAGTLDENDPQLAELLSKMVWVKDAKGNNKAVMPCGSNIGLLLAMHPGMRGSIRYNVVSNEVEIWGGLLGKEKTFKVLRDPDVTNFMNWLSMNPEFHFHKIQRNIVTDQIQLAADNNAYDPLQKYLESTKWDGVSRCETMLETYFQARTVNDEGEDISQYVRAVSKKWLVSCVARALKPGCKADLVMVLEGAQGIGKTQALEILGGEFYSNHQIDPGSKDSAMACAKAWLFELGEMNTHRRNGANTLKEFFSKRADEIRKPYGRVVESLPRRCIFVATTNDWSYLDDETGGRRYLPVACQGKIDLEGLREVRNQLFAEAVVLMKSGNVIWWFDAKEEILQQAETSSRATHDGVAEFVQDWYIKQPIKARPVSVKVNFIAELMEQDVTGNAGIQIGKALRKLGFKRQTVTEAPYVRTVHWLAPKHLLGCEQVKPRSEVNARAEAAGVHVVDGGIK